MLFRQNFGLEATAHNVSSLASGTSSALLQQLLHLPAGVLIDCCSIVVVLLKGPSVGLAVSSGL
jgi:hypothetical protein